MTGMLRLALCSGILCALSTLSIAQNDNHRLHLRYGVFDPTLGTPPVSPALLAGADCSLYVVQFDRAFTDRDRDALRALGARLHSPLPHRALIVHLSQAAAREAEGLPDVRWVGAYHPAYRLEGELLTEHAAGGPVPIRKYNMVMADKRRDKNVLQRKIQAIGGVVTDRHDGSLLFTAELTGQQLVQAARFDEVLWIDRWNREELDMNNARIVQGSNHIEALAGYTGTGIRGHVYEGVEAGHVDWNVAMVNVQSSGAATNHGHATAGCVFGNGTSSINARGHAPDGIGFYTEFQSVTAGFSRNQVINEVVNVHNCLFTTASWGNAQTTQYTSVSADADDVVFDHRVPWTQSQSNTGNQNSRPQAWGKNIISIGGVHHNNNANPADDSWGSGNGSTGPAADGRFKPDLCNFYDDVWTSDRTGNAGYTPGNSNPGFGGTSAATPITAGTCALAIEMFLAGEFNHTPRVASGTAFQNRPYAQTVKALQIACATPYSVAQGTRFQLGWGYPSVDKMYDRRGSISIVPEDTPITQGNTHTYTINVPTGTPELKVCMSFLDPPGNPAAVLHAINDLSLEVIEPSGVRYWGNRGLDSSNASTSGGSASGVDTVECVFVTFPPSGQWTIEVTAPSIAQDAHLATAATDATYALAIMGADNINGGNCARYAPNSYPTGASESEPFGSPAPTALPTLMAANQTSNAGSTAFFDLLPLSDLTLTGFEINTNTPVGTDIVVDVYTTFGSHAGNESNAALWAPQTAGHGIAATVNTPTSIVLNQPIRLVALSPLGIALVARNFNHSHTSGNGTNQAYNDPDLAFTAGAVTSGTFGGTLQTPQVPNVTPLYHLDLGGSVNQVYQTILRQGQLGGAGDITDIAFVAETTGVHYNETLQVHMSHVPAGYTLSSTFATNLPSAATLIDITDHSWHVTADAWNAIGLQQAFAYNGTSDVVVQIRTSGNHHSSPGGFLRGNVAIPRVWASGFGTLSPPASGTVDDSGLRMRVDLDCATAGEYGTSCGPLRASHHDAPVQGTTFSYDLTNGAPNSGAFLAAGFHNSGVYPQSLNVFGLTNCILWHDPAATLFLVTDPSGAATHPFPLPAGSAFDGVMIHAQWFQLDPSQPGGITASNYTRIVIGSREP